MDLSGDDMTAEVYTMPTMTSFTSTPEVTNPESGSTAGMVIQGVLYGALLVFGMVFNCMVMWVIRQKRSLHTVTNMWVTSLCTSQMLLCAISLPIIILTVIADDWLLGREFCILFGFYTNSLRTVSIISVAGVAMDRYHIITRPFSARIRRSSARLWIALTWWCAMVASLPPLLGIGLYRYTPHSHMCGISWSLGGSALIFTVFYATAVYVLTLILSAVSYRLIYLVTRTQAQKRRKPSVYGGLASGMRRHNNKNRLSNPEYVNSAVIDDNDFVINTEVIKGKSKDSPARRRLTSIITSKLNRSRGSLKRKNSISNSGPYVHASIDSRAAQTIFLILSVLCITWIPFFSYALYSAAKGRSGLPYPLLIPPESDKLIQWVEFSVTWLSFSNVVWDPLLYGVLNHNFRSNLRDIYCCGKVRLQDVFAKTKKRRTSTTEDDELYTRKKKSEHGFITANWRTILQNEEAKQALENSAYYVGNRNYGDGNLSIEECQEQMSESAHTMTSLDCDAITSTPSSKRRSGITNRSSDTNSRFFYTPGAENKELTTHNLKVFSAASNSNFYMRQPSPHRRSHYKIDTSPSRSFLSNHLMLSSNRSNISLYNEVMNYKRGQSTSPNHVSGKRRTFPNKTKIVNPQSLRQLPMTLPESGRSGPRGLFSSFRRSDRFSIGKLSNADELRGRLNKTKTNSGRSSDYFQRHAQNSDRIYVKHKSLGKTNHLGSHSSHRLSPYRRHTSARSVSNVSMRSLDPSTFKSKSSSSMERRCAIKHIKNRSLPGEYKITPGSHIAGKKKFHKSSIAL